MWWIVTWSNGQKERIYIYGDELCKLIWIGKVIAIEYDDKYKEEINAHLETYSSRRLL